MKKVKRKIKALFSKLLEDLGWLTAGITLGIFSLAFLLAADIYEYDDTVDPDTLPQVDAIVCLGGGRGRISAAADLWYRYWLKDHERSVGQKIPLLYFAGMGRQVSWGLLAKQIRKSVVQEIQAQHVFIERESSNTETNAQCLVPYVKKQGWKKIILLTSAYHMRRAHFIFEQVLGDLEHPIQIETYSVYQDPFVAKRWRRHLTGVRVTMTEYFKWIYYRLKL